MSQFLDDAAVQRVTLVQATDNKGLDHRLRFVLRRAPDDRPKLLQLAVTASTDCGDVVRSRAVSWTRTLND